MLYSKGMTTKVLWLAVHLAGVASLILPEATDSTDLDVDSEKVSSNEGTSAAVGMLVHSDGTTSAVPSAPAADKEVAALQRRSRAGAGEQNALKDQCHDDFERKGGCDKLQQTESLSSVVSSECADVAQKLVEKCKEPVKPVTPMDSSLAGKAMGTMNECCGANNPVCNACRNKMAIQDYCASVSASTPESQQCPRHKAYAVESKVEYVKMPDGANIRIFVQWPKADGKKFPLIMLLASWGMTLEMYGKKPNEWASYGYVVVTMDMRGFGPFFKSDEPVLGKGAPNAGTVDVAGIPTHTDVSRVITHLIKRPFVDGNQVGLGGISYGAINSFIVASKDARVKAVVAIGGTKSVPQDLNWNNAQNVHWLDILILQGHLGSNFNLDPQVEVQLNHMKEHTKMDQFFEWFSTRLTDIEGLKKNNPAVLAMQGFFDDLFHSQYVFDILKLVSRSKVRMVSEGHIPLGMLLEGMAPGTTNMGWKMWDESLAWFDTYLKGVQEVPSPAVKLQVTNADHTHPFVEFQSWPPTSVAMYLVPTGYNGPWSLYATPENGQPRHELTKNAPATPSADRTELWYDKSLAHHSMRMESPPLPSIANMFKHGFFDRATTVINLLEKSYNLVYLSERFDSNQRLCGVPSIRNFVVYPSKLPVQIFFYLYDIIEDYGVTKRGELIDYTVYAIWPGETDANGAAAAVDQAFHLPDVEFKTVCYNLNRKEESGHRESYRLALGVDLYDENFNDIMRKGMAWHEWYSKLEVSHEKKPYLDLPLVSTDTR